MAPVSRALRAAPRRTRAKPTVSYAESSSDDESRSEEDETIPEATVSHLPNRTRTSQITQKNPPKRKRPSAPQIHQESSAHRRALKKRKPSNSSQRKASASQLTTQIMSSGIIPAWPALPYHILVSIFRYASYPLYDERTFQPLPSSRWLLDSARLCRAFAEPAFTVLYSSPPLVPMVVAHRLVDLLKANPIPMTFKYRQKVESLRIDVGQVVIYSLPGSGHLDLHGLIKDLPRLSELEFYHQLDMPPYRQLDDPIKWAYPEGVFEALEHVDRAADPLRGDKTSVCKLRSWRWSSRMAGKKFPIHKIPEIHLKESFSSLKKIAFVNYQYPVLKKDEEDPKHEDVLAQALKALPELEHLILEASTLCNAKLLPKLPTNLRNLELISCWEVVADDFASFLLTHGRQLRCLTLNHNHSLSMAFLPVLGTACPKLQVFRMNLTYFHIHQTYRDWEPLYESLLLPGQIPVWPSTLQIIELTQLRKWETEAAEMFFSSLLNNAENFPDLRKLTIQAILNISWRDRASFRDKWVGSLHRVFKRISDSPKSYSTLRHQTESDMLPTVASNPLSNENHAAIKDSQLRTRVASEASTSSSGNANDISPPTRRSKRTSTKNLQSGKYAETSEDSDTKETSATRTAVARRTEQRRNKLERELTILKQTIGNDRGISSPTYISSDGSEDEDGPLMDRNSAKGKGKEREIIQGMCDVVEVRIDNLRPAETQATEADFLDEEKSGDEDWNGDDYDGGDKYAW